ncbi:MAG: NAD(P)-dependent oxidoreductase [Synergistaceae bacterium]|nr:NAD(P)-dependent oxidoreductase [Synergistaceae bacterium]
MTASNGEGGKPVVGFIGTGVMGQSMAGHLIDAGYSLNVYNRTEAKCEPLVRKGAKLKGGPGEVAADSDIVITIVGFPKDVEQVYLDPGGVIDRAKPGSLLIDMTTSSPELAERVYNAARPKGLGACDAPVTGGDRGAREATLSILVGGTVEDFNRALPLFKIMGKNIVHLGPAGFGQRAKLANQIIIAGTMLGMCEGLAYARKSGIDIQKLFDCLANGAAGSWSLTNYTPRILNGDFNPGFFVKHFVKDMRLASQSAKDAGFSLKGLETALEQYIKLENDGYAESGTQALYKLYCEE